MVVVGLTAIMAQQTHDIKGVVTDKRNDSRCFSYRRRYNDQCNH